MGQPASQARLPQSASTLPACRQTILLSDFDHGLDSNEPAVVIEKAILKLLDAIREAFDALLHEDGAANAFPDVLPRAH